MLNAERTLTRVAINVAETANVYVPFGFFDGFDVSSLRSSWSSLATISCNFATETSTVSPFALVNMGPSVN